ncbi:hypothetical protein P3T36_002826 [Kitasatospora sp. MAP12-15]|uniref:hypothetical protein n=1 Tax=unclassified Kitasatospora TaxID=2633591 RepID=UPI002475EBB8|nr:hypothetical protein [Kitasatospora sp. MAP12-44]MDH6114005.1 hypothetical protein [Kitasatospora sp. MAP12-44]
MRMAGCWVATGRVCCRAGVHAARTQVLVLVLVALCGGAAGRFVAAGSRVGVRAPNFGWQGHDMNQPAPIRRSRFGAGLTLVRVHDKRQGPGRILCRVEIINSTARELV